SLSGVKVGFTNEFKHGNTIEKLLGGLISTNGWHLGPFALNRPASGSYGWNSDATSLTMEFQLSGSSNGLANSELVKRPRSYRTFRVRHWGEDGYVFTEELREPWISRHSDGYFGYVNTPVFARPSR